MTQQPQIDIAAEAQALLHKAHARPNGLAVNKLIDQPGQRVMAIALTEGSELPRHDAPPAACLHVLTGEVVLVAGDDRQPLQAGSLIQIPQRSHHLEAVTDCFALLTVTTTQQG
ncbi:hypothetical protein K0651_05695 [Ornithinimicrobium sp. Arc0846-15]|nr:hypothetical protein [Ornithinimicrobium laminariae]